MSQQQNIKWSIVIPLVVIPPLASALLLYLTVIVPALTTSKTALSQIVKSYGNFTSYSFETLEEILLILVGLSVSATLLYLIARMRRVLLARMWVTVLVSLSMIPACTLGIYTILLFTRVGITASILTLLTGLALSILLVLLFFRGGFLRYVAVLVFSMLTSIDLIVWLDPSLTFILLAVFPVIDYIVVYYGPLRELVRAHRGSSSAQEASPDKVTERHYNPLSDLTVKIDGMLLGLGDFLLYSTAVAWSLMVLSYKLKLLSLPLVVTVVLPALALGFYANVKLCLKKGYGPATLGPLLSVVAVTLALLTLL